MRTRTLAACLALAAMSRAANADPARYHNHWFIDLAPTVGVGHVDGAGTGAAVGWRPELVYVHLHDADGSNGDHTRGLGVGFYGAVTKIALPAQHDWESIGVSVVGYLPKSRSLALSMGVAGDGHGAMPEGGVFAGWRFPFAPFDVPVGARLDVAFGHGDAPTAWTAQVQVDVLPLTVALLAVLVLSSQKD